MTKFYNYLNEVSLDDINLSQFIEECYPALQDTKKNGYTFLYSGRKTSDIVIRKEIRKNRKPVDTPEEIHNILNDEFKKKFGVKARSQSIFVVPEGDVSDYGNPFYVFPVGKKYMYIWSEQIKDLYPYLGRKIKKEFQLAKYASINTISWLISVEGSFHVDMNLPESKRIPIRPNSHSSSSNMKKITEEEYMNTVKKIIKDIIQLYKKSNTIKPFTKSEPFEVMVVADYVWLINSNKVNTGEMEKWINDNIR